MKEKFTFLLSLKLLECEITELTNYSKACCECYELLQIKLDELCEFMVREETRRQWKAWQLDKDIQDQAGRLREVSVKALCDVEKHQSQYLIGHELDRSNYLAALFQSVRGELQSFGMNCRSKILFIGSGAFPVSVLTIAKECGAEVLGVDLDSEAVLLAEQVAKAYGLDTLVSFSDKKLSSLPFLKEASHIIIASLVENKREVLEQLIESIKDDAKIIVRYGNGVKSLFNYPFENDLSGGWLQSRPMERNPIYDVIILEKSPAHNKRWSLQM